MNILEFRREELERDRRELLLAQAREDLVALNTENLADVVVLLRVKRLADDAVAARRQMRGGRP
jgi:hypothetical protein